MKYRAIYAIQSLTYLFIIISIITFSVTNVKAAAPKIIPHRGGIADWPENSFLLLKKQVKWALSLWK